MNINARVLLYCDTVTDKWAAQCLEYDIAAQGNTLDEVKERFARTFIGNIVLALVNEETPLATFLPAPHKFTEMWNRAMKVSESMSVTIASDELPPNVLDRPERVPRGYMDLAIAA